MTNFHSFHIVNNSPWPIINSYNIMNLLFNSMMIIKFPNNSELTSVFFFNLNIMILTMFSWWRDITREGAFQGFHTFNVWKGLKMSMILFILSEIMFFFSFFWGFFHFSLSPEIELSNSWPPIDVLMFNPYQIPLLNTMILLSSGATVTWCHHLIIKQNFNLSMMTLTATVTLGVVFSYFQAIEYYNSLFSINDSSFGSIFYLSTGFHGTHVLIGTTFLLINLMRMYKSHLNNKHHFSFEAAAWYWHFVDVVWIYLYTFVYWWFW